MNKKRLIGYCRVSSVQQEQEGVSLEMQESRIRNYCAAMPDDIELVDVVHEQKTASTLNRKRLNQVRQRCMGPNVDGLIVIKLDRLTRSVRDITDLIDTDLKHYQLISLQEHLDTKTATGRMMLNMIVMISQWERETIGERTKAAIAYKKAQGHKLGGFVPYGYKVIEKDGNKVLAINPEEYSIVSIIKDRIKYDGFGLSAVADELARKGYTNRKGNPILPTQIKRIYDYEGPVL